MKPIRTEDEYKLALSTAEGLWDVPADSAEADTLAIITMLVEDYVRCHHPITDPDPIDFLILDVYKELDRLRSLDLLDVVMEKLEGLPEKSRKTFQVMNQERLDASQLLRKSGLNAKDFDDNLERLKFFLKKL